jgi:hypothetical protein
VDISYPEIEDPAAMSASRITYLTARHDWTRRTSSTPARRASRCC